MSKNPDVLIGGLSILTSVALTVAIVRPATESTHQNNRVLAEVQPAAIIPTFNDLNRELRRKGHSRWQAPPQTIKPTEVIRSTERRTKVRFS